MKAVIQRVTQSAVHVNDKAIGAIAQGVMVLLGVAQRDRQKEADWLVEKIVNLRIFEDDKGKMNRSLIDVQGSMLVVSQFTLYGDCRKGRRPSFVKAAPAAHAEALYDYFVERAKALDIKVATGKFQAMMQVSLVNDGPVTLIVETPSD